MTCPHGQPLDGDCDDCYREERAKERKPIRWPERLRRVGPALEAFAEALEKGPRR